MCTILPNGASHLVKPGNRLAVIERFFEFLEEKNKLCDEGISPLASSASSSTAQKNFLFHFMDLSFVLLHGLKAEGSSVSDETCGVRG